MEDLNERGLIKATNEKPFDLKISKLIIDYFSKFQSYFWGLEKHKNIEWINNYNFGEYMKEFTIKNFDNKKYYFIQNNKNQLTENTIDIIKNIKIEDLFELINPFNNRNKDNTTLLHGDENNIKKEDIKELKDYYFDKLIKNGINSYSRERFDEDWKNLCMICLCNIIAASAEENIGDDEEKKKKYSEHILKAEKRFISFIQNQKL